MEQINSIKRFNYQYIYKSERFEPFKEYSALVIRQIFNALMKTYAGKESWREIDERKKYYPVLMDTFGKWLAQYCEISIVPQGDLRAVAANCENRKIYGGLADKKIYASAVIDFISGMTDRFAIKVFNELLTY